MPAMPEQLGFWPFQTLFLRYPEEQEDQGKRVDRK